MLSVGSNWLDATPTFNTTSAADAEGLGRIHATARTLAERRSELNLSQSWVAGWAQVTRQTVAAIEDGTTWPDYLTVLKVAAVLGLTLQPTASGLPIGPRPGHGMNDFRPKGWN